MKKVAKTWRLLLVISMITIPTIIMAKDDPGGDSEPGDNTLDVPFDGGISLLVAAGIGYGLKKAYDKKKDEKDSATIRL